MHAIERLTDIGNSVEWDDKLVMPTQCFAQYIGKETKVINQALERVAETGRLKLEKDYYKLSKIQVTACHLKNINDFVHPNFGITLLTRLACNTLVHYFNDPTSVARSNHINSQFTDIQELCEIDEYARQTVQLLTLKAKQYKEQKENEQQFKAIDSKFENVEDRLASIETPISRQFPKGCISMANIQSRYARGLSRSKIKRALRDAGQPFKTYRIGDESGAIVPVDVYVEKGVPEVINSFKEKLTYLKTTSKVHHYRHPNYSTPIQIRRKIANPFHIAKEARSVDVVEGSM